MSRKGFIYFCIAALTALVASNSPLVPPIVMLCAQILLAGLVALKALESNPEAPKETVPADPAPPAPPAPPITATPIIQPRQPPPTRL